MLCNPPLALLALLALCIAVHSAQHPADCKSVKLLCGQDQEKDIRQGSDQHLQARTSRIFLYIKMDLMVCRLNELRLLKLKLGESRRELHILKNSVANIDILKHAVHCLGRELLQERTKVKALSEELENPLNVHRSEHLHTQGCCQCVCNISGCVTPYRPA